MTHTSHAGNVEQHLRVEAETPVDQAEPKYSLDEKGVAEQGVRIK